MNFSISLNSVLSAINSKSLLSFLSSTIYPSYGIYYASGDNANRSAIDFNSVIKFDHSGEAVITSAPVASSDGVAGNYSSLNKVVQPSKITMRIAVEGMTGFSGAIPRFPSTNNFSLNASSRSDVINKLEQMKNSATLYNIETPDRVYASYDLINYQFATSSSSGITLLMVDLTFQEVRTLFDIEKLINSVKKAATTEAKTPEKEIY
ncbi:hypothetical protein DES39_0561 [Orbus hercynius]|uniref:Dit-like phage tail protein N-terminal domain-containing protein n=1 Tax=Orbus hercynius TaxID=593135 RepID=A0A495RJ68_9GAMM|nr:hypothetical protein [Orbus hercynius]RKS87340.1 hypothetical protein DES39_0561 [Orbus hercynius]